MMLLCSLVIIFDILYFPLLFSAYDSSRHGKAPYYQFKNAGYEVVVSSPAGGPIPIDAGSMAEGFFTADAKKFMVR